MQYFNIFDKNYTEHTPTRGVVTPSDLSHLRQLYSFNRDSLLTYYRDRNFSVKNTHILSRVLEHIPIYPQYDGYRYLEFFNDKITYLAKHFKFTSDLEKGIVHPPYFFGNDGEEIIISDYEPFGPTGVEQCWTTENVITILRHHRNDNKLLLPLGNDDGCKSGLCSVLINFPKLAIKYREFVKEQTRKTYSGDENQILLTKNHFVMKYVLGPSMETIIDHTFLNKVMDKFYGNEEVVPKFKHRFKLFEPETQINRYVENTLDVITNKQLDFVNLLRNIQLMFSKNACDLLSLSDLGTTRQVKWALVASRIDHMLFMYDVCRFKDINKHHLNDWSRLAKRLLRDNSYQGMFSFSVEQDLTEKLYKLSQL